MSILFDCSPLKFANQVQTPTLFIHSDQDQRCELGQGLQFFTALKKNGVEVSGPVPLPTKKEVVTIIRAVHKYKDSREQFEQRTHKRLIDIMNPNQKIITALSTLEVPAGVFIQIKMKNN